MQITIHANAPHIHMSAEQSSQLPEAAQDEQEDDLNAPLTGKDLRGFFPRFVAAITQILDDKQSKAPDTTP